MDATSHAILTGRVASPAIFGIAPAHVIDVARRLSTPEFMLVDSRLDLLSDVRAHRRVARITVDGSIAGRPLTLSFIAKELSAYAASFGGAHLYVHPEVAFYCSFHISLLPSCLTTPSYIQLLFVSPGTHFMCVSDEGRSLDTTAWQPAVISDIARHVAIMNVSLPPFRTARMSGSDLAARTRRAKDSVDALPEIVRRHSAGHLISSIDMRHVSRVLGRRDTYLDILNQLPLAFAHNDVTLRSVLASSPASTCLADWDTVGGAPFGTELSSLVFASLFRADASAPDSLAVEGAAFDGYLEGLAASNASYREILVRRAYAAASALRLLRRCNALRELRGAVPSERAGRKIERFARLLSHSLALAFEI